MKQRLDWRQVAPEAQAAMRALYHYTENCGLDRRLLELVKIRASQINGCAYCIHMHTADARKLGESEERIYLLSAWRESPLYDPRERAALAWTEALTLIAESQAPDAVYDEVCRHFSEKELVNLTVAIGMINVWNRVCVGFRAVHPVPAAAAAQ